MRGPWHIWVVGLASLVWNAGGAYDYLMTQTANEAYVALLGPAQWGFLEAAPAWFDAGWAFGVWASIAGSLLILVRSRLAFAAFWMALAGILVSAVYSFFIANPTMLALAGTASIAFSGLIVAMMIMLLLYCRAMIDRGHLR